MTTALRITSGIFLALAGALYRYHQDLLALIFTCIAIILALFSLFTHHKETKKDSKSADPDSIVVSELHHPDLRDSRYSNSVLWCSIVNKSDAIVTINNVRAYDSADRLLPTAWSNGLKDDLGNLSDFTGLLAIKAKETSSIYLRHLHMTDIFICRIEIYHSLSDKPIIKTFDDTTWES